MGLDAMILVFWMLSFKPTFSLFSSYSLSAVRVVSSAYLRLLIFLPAILIPACDSSSPAFLIKYSAFKINKQGDNIQPWRTPFPMWNQSVVQCPVLTVASWSAYRFLRRQVWWSAIPILDWNAKVGSQGIPGVTDKFGLEVQNEARQRLAEFCQENTLVIANTLCQQHKRRLYTWTSPNGQYLNQNDYILCSHRWRSSIQSAEIRPGGDWLRSWTPYFQIQIEIEESRENH